MSILHNAIQAIECGIEDFSVGTDARLKSSIRGVHAGVLLLFKEKLSRLSPDDSDEALIKQRVMPEIVGGAIVWKGKGKKTVDVQNIKERFSTLGISVDWSDFDAINRIRNQIEHYYTTANANTIREALAKSFGIISEFLASELSVDPKSQFSESTWSVFIGVADVYEKERENCLATHSSIDAYSEYVVDNAEDFSCSSCGSNLVVVNADGSADCRSCSTNWDREELIVAIVENAASGDNFLAVKDGGTVATANCPECGLEGLIVDEMICACCGEQPQTECNRCSSSIPIEELDGSGYCGYCTHMMSKND